MSGNKVYCGIISIIGRPNVGKSTLFNKLLGKKISITSSKARTTRSYILGICTEKRHQAVYIDTPGFDAKKERLNESLLRIKKEANFFADLDLIIFVTESARWTLYDENIIQCLRDLKISVILALNKIDNLHKKSDLLPRIQFLATKIDSLGIVPISAKTGMNIDIISSIVQKNLPKRKFFFSEEKITDSSLCFMASEIIREKLMRFLGDELPYSISVDIEHFQYTKYGNYHIMALVFVENVGQKKIVIGNRGSKIRIINIKARKDMQEMFKAPVFLKLWIKVRRNV